MQKNKYFKCNKIPKLKKSELAERINSALKQIYPDAECALNYQNDPFRLLVMARLSAQCTDKRVNEVSKELFNKFPDSKAFENADLEQIEEYIRPCGLFHTKAKSIKEMSIQINDKFCGKIPETKEELMMLSGVGEKIANLMLGDVFGQPSIVADTHLIRLSSRFGLSATQNPSRVTKDLEKLIPREDRSDFCHRVITLGRNYCKAQNPDCENCPLVKIINEE